MFLPEQITDIINLGFQNVEIGIVMNIIKKFALSIVLAGTFSMAAGATELPPDILRYIKNNVPGITVRFDGLVEFADGTKYIPVLPMSYQQTLTPSQVVMTIPSNMPLAAKPELILFANDFAMMKVIKSSSGVDTISNSPNIPLKVKMGIFPQDFIVPEKFAIPAELRILTGNLKIPVRDEINTKKTKTAANSKNAVIKNVNNHTFRSPELEAISKSKIYAVNFNASSIYDLSLIKPANIESNIQLPTISSDIKFSPDGRYILVTCFGTNSIAVVDTSSNKIIKYISVGEAPSSIFQMQNIGKIGVVNSRSSNITVIDAVNMVEEQTIPLLSRVESFAYSRETDTAFYNDPVSGKIYKTFLSEPEKNSAEDSVVGIVSNISRMVVVGDKLYVLSRHDNKLYSFDTANNKLISQVPVPPKPVDFVLSKDKDKLYVLSADSKTLAVIDVNSFTVQRTLNLTGNGFPKSIAVFDSGKLGFISYVNSPNLSVINFEKEAEIDVIPIAQPVSNIMVSEVEKL